jgi:hypothetical protein
MNLQEAIEKALSPWHPPTAYDRHTAARIAKALASSGPYVIQQDGTTARLERAADPDCDACGGDGWVYDDEDGGSYDCHECERFRLVPEQEHTP